MLALQILKHSFLQLTGNFRQALAISVVPFLVQMLAFAGFLYVATQRAGNMDATNPGSFDGMLGPILIVGLIALITTIWIAVNWHRYVLLNERQGAVPDFKRKPAIQYAVSLLLIVLILIPVMIVFGFITGAILQAIQPSHLVQIVYSLLIVPIAVAVTLRLSVALPAAAVGIEKPISTAWRATIGATGTILALAYMLTLLQFAVDQALFRVIAVSLNIGIIPFLVLQLLAYWFWTLFGLSILTTLYGHYVEKRTLR